MKLTEIEKEWEKDCKIGTDLSQASLNTPNLHAKYLDLYTKARVLHKQAEQAQYNLLKDKWLYYEGKMSKEELDERGWDPDPFNGLKVLRGQMDYYYNSDPEIQASEKKIHFYKGRMEILKEILDNLKWRHQTIKNAIEWRRFEAGG